MYFRNQPVIILCCFFLITINTLLDCTSASRNLLIIYALLITLVLLSKNTLLASMVTHDFVTGQRYTEYFLQKMPSSRSAAATVSAIPSWQNNQKVICPPCCITSIAQGKSSGRVTTWLPLGLLSVALYLRTTLRPVSKEDTASSHTTGVSLRVLHAH